MQLISRLFQTPIVFWDFDGVIKNSVSAKGDAYVELFQSDVEGISSRIMSHHLSNGGVSRFEKIPLYMQWAGIELDPTILQTYLERYSEIVFKRVVESEWIPGVLGALKRGGSSSNILVTATPESEIRDILLDLGIYNLFDRVYGAPTEKLFAIEAIMEECPSHQARDLIFIGDSPSDYSAARKAGVRFFLRKTESNEHLRELADLAFGDFYE